MRHVGRDTQHLAGLDHLLLTRDYKLQAPLLDHRNLFIVMAVLMLQLWKLAELALPLLVMLAAQVVLNSYLGGR